MQISANKDNHNERKNVATDKNCTLWKNGCEALKPEFNISCKIGFFCYKMQTFGN